MALGVFVGIVSLLNAVGRKPAAFMTFETTTLHMEHRDLIVTSQEAEKIRQALQVYLSSASTADLEKTIPAEFVSALPRQVDPPRVDATGQIRYGPWRMESEGNQVELTCRLPKADQKTAHYVLRYTAHLDENPWKVSSITFEQVSTQ